MGIDVYYLVIMINDYLLIWFTMHNLRSRSYHGSCIDLLLSMIISIIHTKLPNVYSKREVATEHGVISTTVLIIGLNSLGYLICDNYH